MRLANSKSVRDHILEMKDISDKLNSLSVTVSWSPSSLPPCQLSMDHSRCHTILRRNP
uniref:Uncharacterized protein n=1 Tax=Nelumbo nucifera TaxID=4432 RepID=A0A822YZ29_NELNU|nr:TPA_asm: hypothetical protein HUJ06_008411 [Nelumbo nucifera]